MLRDTTFKDRDGKSIIEGDYLIIDIQKIDKNTRSFEFFNKILELFDYRYYQIHIKPTDHLQMDIETSFVKADFSPVYDPEYFYSISSQQEKENETLEEYSVDFIKDKTDKVIYNNTVYYNSLSEMKFHQEDCFWVKIDNNIIVERI